MATAQWRPLIQSGLLLPLSLARRSLRIITRARNTQSVRLSLDFAQSLSYIITRVAPHCVNTLRILHAAYDATNTTRPIVNTHSVR